jgi:hypothetical protein
MRPKARIFTAAYVAAGKRASGDREVLAGLGPQSPG